MPAQNPPFSSSEFDRRIKKTRMAMAGQGIDLLFCEDPSNMAWLTGYDGWSFYVHQGVVLTQEGDPVWWGRSQDGNGAVRTVWMTDDNVRRYGDQYVQSTVRHPMEDLAKLITEFGHAESRIGLELDNYYFSAKAYLTLMAQLPGARIVDATGLVNWQRMVKSPEELTFMRRAAAISRKITEGIVERVEPGLKKNALVAEIYSDAITGADGHWGDYPAIVPLLPSGADASAPHLTWDGREFASGQATFFEISGCYRRYHAPLCRTVFLGSPPPHMVDAEKALVAGLEAGLQAARAGNRACDVASALKDELKKAGIERSGRVGYPIGLSYPPDWGERTVSLREDDESVLEAGMSFHFMPGLWMSDWGLEITESIVIRENGPAECLCDFPRKLFVKD